jgi:hypothetical protein
VDDETRRLTSSSLALADATRKSGKAFQETNKEIQDRLKLEKEMAEGFQKSWAAAIDEQTANDLLLNETLNKQTEERIKKKEADEAAWQASINIYMYGEEFAKTMGKTATTADTLKTSVRSVTPAIEEAASSATKLAGQLSAAAMAGASLKESSDSFDISPSSWRSTQSGQWSEAFKKAWATQPYAPGSAEWWKNSYGSSEDRKAAASQPYTPAPVNYDPNAITSYGQQGSGIDYYDAGGIVPGPRGTPRLAIVHGGEEVLTPDQRGGGGTTVNQVINGVQEPSDVFARRVARELSSELRRLVRDGKARLN